MRRLIDLKKLYCTAKLVSVIEALKLVTIEVESWSQTPSLRLRRHGIHCIRTILTTFYYMHNAAAGDMASVSLEFHACTWVKSHLHCIAIYQVTMILFSTLAERFRQNIRQGVNPITWS
jgi:hypothetical protein